MTESKLKLYDENDDEVEKKSQNAWFDFKLAHEKFSNFLTFVDRPKIIPWIRMINFSKKKWKKEEFRNYYYDKDCNMVLFGLSTFPYGLKSFRDRFVHQKVIVCNSIDMCLRFFYHHLRIIDLSLIRGNEILFCICFHFASFWMTSSITKFQEKPVSVQ